MLTEEAKLHFQRILFSWYRGVDSNTVYHFILEWIEKYKESLLQDLSKDMVLRMESGESAKSIVEDIIYSKKYKSFREECTIIKCERCTRYEELIDNNFHEEAEEIGTCGVCN